jgi:23S rRNA (pseudouridine1915-N3)-methyltransferase
MKLRLAWVGPRSRAKSAPVHALTEDYLKRLSRYVPTETREYASEEALLKESGRAPGRTAPVLVVLDSRGKQISSEGLAEFLRTHQDGGTQLLVFAIGPADGFSGEAIAGAQAVISLGKMTYPHELVRVLLAEQLYRAFCILKGHPYHCGH